MFVARKGRYHFIFHPTQSKDSWELSPCLVLALFSRRVYEVLPRKYRALVNRNGVVFQHDTDTFQKQAKKK